MPPTEPMGAPPSFTARRPNASNLPQFELPPPQLPAFQKYQHNYHPQHTHQQPLASVGNLLTPPSGSSADGLSPTSSAGVVGGTTASTQPMAPYTPGYSWPQSNAGNHYNFQQPAMSPSTFNTSRAPFSPSLSSIVKNASSPNPNELPQSSHSDHVPQYPSSMSMNAPMSLPSMQSQQHMAMMGQGSMSAPITQASPVHSQDAFSRQPPTPTYYNGPNSATPAQTPFPYSAGPSPVQHSPVSAGPLSRMSPTHPHGQIPSIHSQMSQSPYSTQRPFSYPIHNGPVLSNMNNPGSQMSMVGGMSGGMVHGYNSGHAAALMYHGGQPQGQNNDRPFKCDQCPQSFNRNHDLKRHKRIHLAVKPFPCGHCDKSFSRKDALKRHILVKGCGKAGAVGDSDKRSSDGSVSPTGKSEMAESSPIISATA
ncbi:hypothetical protein CAC42_6517 [Sphaceloma murrayae]|uniref:C2H2-type domain-containing protein n=1 Tax=Sphaceloma murrayae TaxID=2082308 RepID=A0A2K1QFR3_9PEZI|nr:hypothetical protein CAC42_6517 [Sphaceloma murrayae]